MAAAPGNQFRRFQTQPVSAAVADVGAATVAPKHHLAPSELQLLLAPLGSTASSNLPHTFGQLATQQSQQQVAGAYRTGLVSTPRNIHVRPAATVADFAAPDIEQAGGTVSIGGSTYDVLQQIGIGSFGVVWEVREQLGGGRPGPGGGIPNTDGEVLVLKTSRPSQQDGVDDAILEAEVLRLLSGALAACPDVAARVPRYVVHSVATVRPVATVGSKSTIRLVMSKVEGQSLQKWLFGVDVNAMKTMPAVSLLHGPLPGSRMATRDLDGACRDVSALLAQVSPVFAALSEIAYHRDIAAHNFLVREVETEKEFGLVDFGLAVRSQTWRREWQSMSIAGDPRYWTPAAWMSLAHGHKYVAGHSNEGFRRQYEERVDHFALGVLSLEVLFTFWNVPDQTKPGAKSTLFCEETEDDVDSGVSTLASVGDATENLSNCDYDTAGPALTPLTSMMDVRAAWHSYFTELLGLFQMLHARGEAVVAQQLRCPEAMDRVLAALAALTSALEAAASVVPVLGIIADLLNRQGTLSWHEIPQLIDVCASHTQEWNTNAVKNARIEKEVSPRTSLSNHLSIWSADEVMMSTTSTVDDGARSDSSTVEDQQLAVVAVPHEPPRWRAREVDNTRCSVSPLPIACGIPYRLLATSPGLANQSRSRPGSLVVPKFLSPSLTDVHAHQRASLSPVGLRERRPELSPTSMTSSRSLQTLAGNREPLNIVSPMLQTYHALTWSRIHVSGTTLAGQSLIEARASRSGA